MDGNRIIDLSAVALTREVSRRQLSCREVVEAFLARIDEVNGTVNALCTLDADAALAQAERADRDLAGGVEPGLLFGLPIAVKDLIETRGMRTTMGSPLLRDWVPDYDHVLVERLRAAGAILVGKTNTPEFGAGSQTFNSIFGATRNPYDLSRTVGGSSGGAAAAVAACMLPVADGSDLGGSLRNPASFCNVVGFRVSPGLVPVYPSRELFDTLGVIGPMARTTTDAALLLSAMVGADPRDPLSLATQSPDFGAELSRNFGGTKIAWSPDLGFLPVDPRVVEVLEKALVAFDDLGCVVERAEPDLRGAEEVFLALRSQRFLATFAATYEKEPEKLKDTIRWNVEQGLAQKPGDVPRAEMRRSRMYQGLLGFFSRFDFLALPAAQVPPFPIEQEWVHEIAGQPLENYLQWMQICCAISLMPVPALSIPAGFTEEGLPIGLQLVGRPRGDFELLQLAHAFEAATRCGDRHPPALS